MFQNIKAWFCLFFSAAELTWQAGLKNTKVKCDLLTNFNMLSMVEQGIRDGNCRDFYQFVKANNKYKKSHKKNLESWYFNYKDLKNLYDWAIL